MKEIKRLINEFFKGEDKVKALTTISEYENIATDVFTLRNHESIICKALAIIKDLHDIVELEEMNDTSHINNIWRWEDAHKEISTEYEIYYDWINCAKGRINSDLLFIRDMESDGFPS